MSRLLSSLDVRNVVEVLLPSINLGLERFAKRMHLAIRVLNPDSPDHPVVLYELDLGNTSEWEYDYGDIAMRKANLCLREKCDTEVVKIQRPFRYRVDDPPFLGGVYVEGLVVACSGVEGYFDQMFAQWIAAGCRAIATHRFEIEVVAHDFDAIPEYPDS